MNSPPTKAPSHNSYASAHQSNQSTRARWLSPPRSVVVARGLALRVEDTRPVLGLELLLKVPVDEDLASNKREERDDSENRHAPLAIFCRQPLPSQVNCYSSARTNIIKPHMFSTVEPIPQQPPKVFCRIMHEATHQACRVSTIDRCT